MRSPDAANVQGCGNPSCVEHGVDKHGPAFDAACGQEFRAFDGPQKCGRVKGHPGAHTRDPLPSDRRAFDAAWRQR